MTRRRHSLLALAVAGILAAAVPLRAGHGAEQGTIKAFAAWRGDGQAIQTGVEEATFIGAISGTVYVDTEKGPVDSGQMVCPAMLLVNMKDGTQSGSGRCAITTNDGARIFAQLTCTGVHLVGCDGDFTLTGGTGRFAGITGGGRFTVRSRLQQLVEVPGATAETLNGIIFWPELRYAIP